MNLKILSNLKEIAEVSIKKKAPALVSKSLHYCENVSCKVKLTIDGLLTALKITMPDWPPAPHQMSFKQI